MDERPEPARARSDAPHAPALLFIGVALLVWSAGRERLVQDPGIWWHLKLGRDMLASGGVPRVDTLTWTRQGTPWVDQSWLFDLGLAWVVDHWGWSGAVVLSVIAVGGIYACFCAGLLRQGVSPLAGFGAVFLAAGVGSLHFHCRPHLATLAGVAFTLLATRAWHRGKRWAIWMVPPVMILWANLHGGFLAGPLILATAGVGHALAGPLDRQRKRELSSLCVVGVLSLLAVLVNPYGFDLYRHVWRLLVSSRVTDLIQEYRPVALGGGDGWVVELLIVCLIAGPLVPRVRPELYDMAHALIWLHFGMGSVRQAPLMAFACAPVLALYIDGWLKRESTEIRMPSWASVPAGHARALAGGLVALLLLALMLRFPLGGPSPRHWPFQGLAALEAVDPDARVFHDQDWGGFIEAQSVPRRKAFLDDRFELWGRRPIVEYISAMRGGPEWDALLARFHFTHAWIRPDTGLGRRLSLDSDWEPIFKDDLSVLYRRRMSQVSPLRGWKGPGLAASEMAPHDRHP
jgi:hypothetical protein